ncbi:MAG: PSD1 and planctomycete cytochrome C domain-containing protein [Phycisphaeraceae bacterium]
MPTNQRPLAKTLPALVGVLTLSGAGVLAWLGATGAGDHTPRAEGEPRARVAAVKADARDAESVSYNRHIRPILSDKCFACHGFDRNTREAGLRLDVREAAVAERDSGAAIVPGDATNSNLYKRITTTRDALRMPPAELHKPLTADEVELIRRWIDQGADYEPHWAFIPPTMPALPEVNDDAWARNAIDAFVLAKLQAYGVEPSPEADRRTLIRRVYLDLIGLPPTPEEVDAFVKDTTPDAYEKVVDRLLANPHFGERWALPWLDAARYADSNSYQFDNDRWAWPWRDWLIKAINDNRPFDEVIVEMLAGDLLDNPTRDQLLATAFNRHHFLNGEGGAIAEEVRFNYVLDRVETTSTTFLGLTYACAQCHDHKYDPISHDDYFAFFAFFGQVDETGRRGRALYTWDFQFLTAEPTMSLATDAQKQELNRLRGLEKKAYEAFGGKDAENRLNRAARDWAAGLDEDGLSALPPLVHGLAGRSRYGRGFQAPMQQAKLRDYYARQVAPADSDWLAGYTAWNDAQIARMDHEATMPIVMVMRDRDTPREVRRRDRGQYNAPVGEPLEPRLPEALGSLEGLPKNRLGLARWMVSDANPLTARVLVNRLWQEVFGVGIVKTPEDFGLQGALPTHPGLLDYLAAKYRADWDTKAIVREIVTSATYRQSSSASPQLREIDPENELLARGPRFRLPSMLIRDQALAAAGLMNDAMFGPPVYPYQPPALWVDISFAQFEYTQSTGADLYRRSLYTFFRRTLAPPNLFDTANRQACTVKPSRTNTPLQALVTLNDPTYVEAARGLALHAIERRPASGAPILIGEMVRLVLLRSPEQRELDVLLAAYEREHDWYKQRPAEAQKYLGVGELDVPDGIDRAHLAALSAVAQTILNLDETLTKQ